MRKRYETRSTRTRADLVPWDHDYSFYPSLTIFEEDEGPYDTGLLDENGSAIVYYLEKHPLGYRVGNDQ